MKKLVSLLLAVAMLLACASALAEIPEGFHAEGMPIVDEPITISVLTMRWGSMGDSFKTNPFLVNLEKESNVKVNWQIVSSNDWADNQKPVMLAGGESALPEVVLGFQTFSESDIINNVEYFLPLEDLIEQYMPNLTKAFEEMPALKAISTSADGHIYSLPSRMPKRPVACNVPVINVKWLENLGLEVPTTIDELENVLRAFKEQDANGNGDPNDEIPFTGIGLGMDFLSPFGMTDVYGQRYLVNDDGTVRYAYTSEEYKEGIKWAHKLYQDGLIDNELFTQNDQIRDAKCDDPNVSRVGFCYAWSYDAIFRNWKDEYKVIAPIAGPDGERYQQGDLNGLYSLKSNQLSITTVCKHPEVVLRWADQFYTEEVHILASAGEENTDYIVDPDGSWRMTESAKNNTYFTSETLITSGTAVPGLSSDAFQRRYSDSTVRYISEQLDVVNASAQRPFPYYSLTRAQQEKIAPLQAAIGRLVDESIARWVLGEVEISDASFAQFEQALNDAGLPAFMAFWQKILDGGNSK